MLSSRFSRSRLRFATASLAAILALLTVVENGSAWEILAPPAAFLAPKAAGVAPESHSRSPHAAPAEERAVPRQYHHERPAISAAIGSQIANWNHFWIVAQSSEENPASRAEARRQAQYQRDSSQYQDDELMLQIGAALGVAYLVFLGIWIWATRFRPH
jgi:hypothetical protein